MTFGEKLRESRKALNLTQKQLADRVGAKHNSVSDWENDKNKPDPDTIELLCGVLGISPNYLLNSNGDGLSLAETEIIKKYRLIAANSPKGKESIDFILNREYDIVIETQNIAGIKEDAAKRCISYQEAIQKHLNVPVAAHNDHVDEPGELEKMKKDISNLKRPE